MESLSHWDSTEEFSGQAAAALVFGIEPNILRSSITEQDRVKVVYERMANDYERVLKRLYHEVFEIYPDDPLEIYSDSAHELMSVKLKNLFMEWTKRKEEDGPFTEWLLNDEASAFETQRFSRETLADWLDAIQFKSTYHFRMGNAQPKEDLDPLDLPDELDAANVVYRMVRNGYGNQADTPRARILACLKENYPNFSDDAIKRIATVANPDKSTGRKKKSDY